MKKIYKIISFILLIFILVGCSSKELPLPEVTDGFLGLFGVDKNINTENIDQYLGRRDTVYRDMRMLIDPANYEAIGGDRYLSGYIKGFQVIPYPFLAPVYNLPEEVGLGYSGDSLFRIDDEGNYLANYEESLMILEEIFPKDKNIFIMCGGGGYAMFTKDMLIKLGWNKDKIWHIGCYWNYQGKNNVQIKTTYGENNESTYYAFHRVDYLVVDFNGLTPVNLNA